MAALMIQGCGSDVGKSLLVAGLCRAFSNRGIIVRPFKPQNMSNNAAVTHDGGEIGRSTALQALACRTAPSVDMNPVLLKPQSEIAAQLVVRGRRVDVLQADAHMRDKRGLLETALASYRRVRAEAQLVLVEGAGSPAETNLRATDIANMGFAHAADVPVVLVGDIHRGHVIAALVGAHAVLAPEDRARVRGFIVNKFRGDASLFTDGLREIEVRTGWPALGLVPWLPAAATLPAEDAMQLEVPRAHDTARAVRIVIPKLPHIANFDDFDPLRHEPQV
ncbi:MAG: cobyric acid synthase, partial [Steroidobacteraceae bacterium]